MRQNNFLIALLGEYDDNYCMLDNSEHIQEGIKPAFGSPGGKFFVAGKLIKMFPEHKRYVEPFIGGASVLCRKKPSEEEFINDRDVEIFRCYKLIQDLTEQQLKALEAKDWTTREKTFNTLLADYKKNGPAKDPVEQFYQHVYLKAASDAGEMRSYDGRAEGDVMKVTTRLMKIKERFQGVTIENMDYREFIKKYSNEESFTFMDPPYPSARMSWKFCPTQEEFESFSKTVPGKWMITYEICDGWKESKYTRKLLSQYNLAAPSQKHMSRKNELLVVNYDLKDLGESKYLESAENIDMELAHDIITFTSNTDLCIHESKTRQYELNSILDLHAEKRRGKNIKESFDQIKNSFCRCINTIIKEGLQIKIKRMPPFAKELFDEFTTHELTESGFVFKLKESEISFCNFIFYNQWWKNKVTESIADSDFVIATDKNLYFICDKNITQESSAFYLRESGISFEEITDEARYLCPGHELNKTSNASWIKKLDEGKLSMKDINPMEKEIEFEGKVLKKRYKALRQSETSDFWHIEPIE